MKEWEEVLAKRYERRKHTAYSHIFSATIWEKPETVSTQHAKSVRGKESLIHSFHSVDVCGLCKWLLALLTIELSKDLKRTCSIQSILGTLSCLLYNVEHNSVC